MEEQNMPKQKDPLAIPVPPKGAAILMALGPGLVWCGEYIGSGEVIMATRSGALLGLAILWVPLFAVLAKFWIGMAGARYTVCTGEGMIDMLSRTPGPKNWVIWPVFLGQICSAAIATGGLASAAAAFAGYFIPVPQFYLGWAITFIVIALVWSGKFGILKKMMLLLIMVMLIGVFDVVRTTWPGFGELLSGAFGFHVPALPEWAVKEGLLTQSAWAELLPLMGWAAGGFASQVWYTYWVMGAGYGMAHGRDYGQPLDPDILRRLNAEDAGKVKGWCKVMYSDAMFGTLIGVLITVAFVIAGAGVLGPAHKAPENANVAFTLSEIFGNKWGKIGAHLFVMAGLAAMLSTLLGQFAGWPRLLADCARILIPSVKRFSWKVQFRTVLVLFAFSNMVIVYSMGMKPVFLVKLGALLDGLILTPLQALAVGLVLYMVMPKFFAAEARKILKPSPIFAIALAFAFCLFGFVCVFKMPEQLGEVYQAMLATFRK